MSRHPDITAQQALVYEVNASWWACWIPPRFQRLPVAYFAWKVNRKFGRYKLRRNERRRLIAEGKLSFKDNQ